MRSGRFVRHPNGYRAFHPAPLPPDPPLRIEGDLATRPLLAPLALKSWAHAELLSNSVVQAMVDADGFTFSPVLLTGCGLEEADLYALKLASGARFRPAPRLPGTGHDPGGLTWGKLIFQWQTLPLPATNLSANGPDR